jgi:transposase
MRRFRTSTLDQPLLLAPALQDWLPEDHLARFIAEVVRELNLQPILDVYQRKDGRGALGYHPEMLTGLLLYGYATGLTSSRRIEKATYDSVPFRYLAADQHPDHDTIAAFRQQHLEALAKLFVQALQLCSRAGLVTLASVAIDGTKLKANAGWGRGRSYVQLNEEEQKLNDLVKRWMEEAQRADAAEDARFGKGKSEESLPEKLATVEQRLERIRAAKKELEEEAAQRLEEVERAHPPRKRGRPKKGADPAITADPERLSTQAKHKNRCKEFGTRLFFRSIERRTGPSPSPL